MRYIKAILLAYLTITLCDAISYECVMEKDDELEFCVFRGVNYFKNTTTISFTSPSDVNPANVAFKDSNMVGIPRQFLDVFENGLKILKVEDGKLKSVTITRNMEALYARNNFIEKVYVPQTDDCTNLKNLDLSSNRLTSIQNITQCENLKVLNLSGNERLWPKNVIDLSDFSNLNQLEDLNLSDNGIFYLDNLKRVGLISLKVLDLSKNDLIPSDLRLTIFKPFVAMETLKLNDNNMAQLDYAELTGLKALKIVYLNGNNFPCRKVKDMVDFLNIQNNIATPLDRHSNCEDQIYEGMCCQGPLPTRIPTRPPPRPADPTIEDTPFTSSERTTVPDEDSSSSWQIVVAVIFIIAIVGAGAGYIIYRKRSNLARRNHE